MVHVCRIYNLCLRCGLLEFCPTVVMQLWSCTMGCRSAVGSVFGQQELLQLAQSLVRAASSTLGASGTAPCTTCMISVMSTCTAL